MPVLRLRLQDSDRLGLPVLTGSFKVHWHWQLEAQTVTVTAVQPEALSHWHRDVNFETF